MRVEVLICFYSQEGLKMRILVIDDNAQVRKMLGEYLIKNRHSVEIAEDGKQGWGMVSKPEATFDLIFADIKMPVMNGLEFLEKLRENDIEIPVIMMTGYAIVEITMKAFKLGAFDFLIKPFEFKPLLATLDKIASLRATKRELVNISRFYKAKVEFSIPSQTKYVKSIVPNLQDHYKPLCHLYKQDVNGIASCLFEAIMNAIIYGSFGLGSSASKESPEEFNSLIQQKQTIPEFADKTVTIRADLSPERLQFEIEDQGPGFDIGLLPDFSRPMDTLPAGKGLFIIHSHMDSVVWNDSGNCITMVKYLKGRH